MADMKSFLVVDDSKVVRTIARRMLEKFGFAVTEAENGKIALDACLQKMPDAILLDWNMPVMNGIEFLQALRKSASGEAPIVLLCTTENDLNHIRAAMEAGANEYIMKPFDQSILESKLAQVGLIDTPSA